MPTSIPASTLEKFITFGDLLRFLRRRTGLTQMELSIAVGYSNTQISRLEQNERLPDIPTIEARFISALGLEDEPKAAARLLDLAANVRREDAPAAGLSPYMGLNYFDESDTDFFVGREALTAKLIERVLALTSSRSAGETRFLAVVGASGSGKSSLVRAGLVSALRWNKASTDWRIHILTPTEHPLESLAGTLTQESNSVIATATLMDDLARDKRSLQIFAKRILGSLNGSRLLLVVDQFEELFALCRSEEERVAFIGNLLTAASEADGPVLVLITLRADFYAPCADYPRLREALAAHQEYIGAMNVEELRRAIEEPAQRGRWEFEPGLVDLLLHDVGREPGALPLLSHALFETWQRRRGRMLTLSGYTSSGGVRGAIAETAEAVFVDQFTHEQQAIARRIFLRLTELGDEAGAGDTRRRATFDELILKPEEAATTHAVLKALADARLITTTEDAAEVAHEALIREWPTLHGWLEENREGLRLHRQLTETAQDWSAVNHDPDLLYRGARLAQTREWASIHHDEMNALEVEFLAASVEAGEREVAEREAQRQRELEAAQKLAETEKAHAEEQSSSLKRLRQRGIFLVGALGLAIVAAIIAGVFANNAKQQALISAVRELSSAANLNLEIDPERSILLALQAVNKTYAVDGTVLPEAEDALHRAVQSSRIELTLRGHTDGVWSAVYSSDGTRIATASGDGTAKIWDATSGKELLTVQGSTYSSEDSEAGFVWYAALSPDGKLLATAGGDDIARIWDASTGEQLLAFTGHHDDVYHIEFSPDGSRLATVSPDGTAMVWDALTGKVLLTLNQGEGARPYWVTFSPDGSRIAVANTADPSDGWASIWDAVTGELILTLPRQNAYVDSVSFSPDGRRIVTTSEDAGVRIWDANNGEELLTLYGQTAGVANAAYSPDGTRIASAIGNNQVKVWDSATGRELLTLAGHGSGVLTVGFSPDGTRIVTASRDGTARIWNISPNRELLTLVNGPAIASPVGARLTYSPDSTRLAVAYSDPVAKVWDVRTGKLLLSLTGHSDAVNYIAYSFDGTRIATASADGTTKLWDAVSGEELLTLVGHKDWVLGLAFSPDGKQIATSSFDGTAMVWDVETGQKLLTLTGHSGRVANVIFSPDGSRIATSSFDTTARVWDAVTGKQLLTLTAHTRAVRQVVFSPDGARLATASFDGTAKEWDAVSGKELLTLSGHINDVFSVAFSPDGKTVATASGDKTAKLWGALTGKELLTLHAPDGLTSVAFSPDGSQLAVASRDGTDRIYLLKIEDLIALAKQRVTRSLTTEECQQYLHVPACPTEP
jgi:WD40 repeat protein/transcriptional regulator with XRE-family HTH domain